MMNALATKYGAIHLSQGFLYFVLQKKDDTLKQAAADILNDI
jgi:hypothetical protein